jgi:hypothetical protein
MSSTLRSTRVALALFVALATLTGASAALATKGTGGETRQVLKVAGGSTQVTLDPGAATALQSLGVGVAPTGPAKALKSGALAFPVTRGELVPATLAGQIRHSGGLRLSAGKSSLTVDRFRINLDSSPDLSARVNRQRFDRIELFDLDLSGLATASKGSRLEVSGVTLRLSAAGAAALNATFAVDAFAPGLVIGTAKVITEARTVAVPVPATLHLRRGATTVALDPGTAGALTSLGVAVAPTGAAGAGVTGISFPITGGKVASANLAGTIDHIGGLSLTGGKTRVKLDRFVIDTTTGELTGLVSVNGSKPQRVALFALGLDELQSIAGPKAFRLTGVRLSLTASAAGALNGAFGVSAFTEGLAIGTAKVEARVGNGWRHR